jgi:hypothetical protein
MLFSLPKFKYRELKTSYSASPGIDARFRYRVLRYDCILPLYHLLHRSSVSRGSAVPCINEGYTWPLRHAISSIPTSTFSSELFGIRQADPEK